MEGEAVAIRRENGLDQLWSRIPVRGRTRTGLPWQQIREVAHDEQAQKAAQEGLR